MKKYDFLIVGAGLFGSVFAQQAIENGYTCLIIDKRKHNGGNVYTENVEGINIHKYGAHIFRTSDDKLWEYVNRFTKFNNYTNRVKVSYKNEIYSFPINLLTLNKVFGCKTPEEANIKLEEVKVPINSISKNLEEHLLSIIGEDLYKIFFYGYTKKQWGREPKLLPKSIISRIPIRTNFDDNYFNDKYQGIPIGGYTKMIENMQKGADLVLEEDYFENKIKWNSISNMIVYTGPIDQFYDYKFGKLEYRSLKFEEIKINKSDYQGCAVMNFTDDDIEYTRIIEHKHFEFGNQKFTIISKEYPKKWSMGEEPYYPINDEQNNNIYLKYKKISEEDKKIIFGGRLAEYRYYDMQQVIASALSKFKKLNLENKNKEIK